MGNFIKKALASCLAPVIMATTTPPAIGEGEKGETNDLPKTPVIEIADEQMLTADDFAEEREELDKHLFDRLSYHLSDVIISRSYYSTNIDFIPSETPFVDAGYADGDSDERRFTNKEETESALAIAQGYNQGVVNKLGIIPYLATLRFGICDKEKLRSYLEKTATDPEYTFYDAVLDYNITNPKKPIVIEGMFSYYRDDFLSACLAEALKDENFDIETFIAEYIPLAKEHCWELLIHPGAFCHSERDKAILEQIFRNWFEANYIAIYTSPLNKCEPYNTTFEQLTSTCTKEGEYNINEASTGAQYIGQSLMSYGLIRLQQRYSDMVFHDDLPNYYDANKLAEDEFVLVVKIKDPINELEKIIFEGQELDKCIEDAEIKFVIALLNVDADTKEASR